MMHEEIVTRTGRAWVDENGIIRFIVSPGAEQRSEDVEEVVAAAKKLTKGKKPLLLIDLREIRSITRDARNYLSRRVGEESSACALLIGTAVSRVIGSFLVGLNRAIGTMRLFASENEAVEWLRGMPA
ncbi:MAG: STAS/SEC14 domain-containing protein [Candidatus Thermoplasmatota archaeon]